MREFAIEQIGEGLRLHAWREPQLAALQEQLKTVDVLPPVKEALMLEAVKLIVDSGVDVNAANSDGRTALDAARALRYDSVVQLLTEKGAKAGTGAARGARQTR